MITLSKPDSKVLLKDGRTDAAVGSLNVEHSAHGGSDVGHVGQT